MWAKIFFPFMDFNTDVSALIDQPKQPIIDKFCA